VSSGVQEQRDGRLDVDGRRVGAQIETGADVRRVRAGTDSHLAAVDVQVVDQLRDEELGLCKNGRPDRTGCVQNEDDVEWRAGILS